MEKKKKKVKGRKVQGEEGRKPKKSREEKERERGTITIEKERQDERRGHQIPVGELLAEAKALGEWSARAGRIDHPRRAGYAKPTEELIQWSVNWIENP